MSIKKFSNASAMGTGGKSHKLWDQTTFQSGMFALATVSLTSTASSVVFSNIPSTYTHLQLRVMTKDSRPTYANNNFDITFNGDTAANYSWHRLQGEGSSATAGGFGSMNNISVNWSAGSTAPGFGVGIIDVLDYANTTKAKTIKILGGVDVNGTIAGFGGVLNLNSGAWYKNTSSVYDAITSITFTPGNSPFVVNSHFALYGIKSA